MPRSQRRSAQDINPPPSTFGFFPIEEPVGDLDQEPASDLESEEGFEGYEGKTILEMSQPQFPLLSQLSRAHAQRQPDVVGLSTSMPSLPYMGYTSPYHNQPMFPDNGADLQPQQQHHPGYTQQYPGRAVAIDPGLIAAAANAINDTALKMKHLELATNDLNKSLSTTSDCLNHLHAALKGDLVPAAAPPDHVPPPATLHTSLAITADHLNNLRAVLSGWQHPPMAPPAAFAHHQAPPSTTMHPAFPAPAIPRKRDFSAMNTTTTSFAEHNNNNNSATNATPTTPFPPPPTTTTTTPAAFPPSKHLSNPLLPAPLPHIPPSSTATPWSAQEKQWLRDQATRYKDVRPRPSNRQLVREFNEHWVGRRVLGHSAKKGPVLSRPREPRSERAVETVVRRYGLWEGITLDNDSHRRRLRRAEQEGGREGVDEGAEGDEDEGAGGGVEEEDAEEGADQAEGLEAEGQGAAEM
ncbi:hypothetical protein SLS58_008747 [Diplodia intermedia]|uniref:Myb-like domain-containing protein n=1 Tax=Diplodia intermedia TaxID=856260 RepID=A0ABR3TGI9_9PEZI